MSEQRQPGDNAPLEFAKHREKLDCGTYRGPTIMTPEQWSDVPDNPRQRDTEKHAKRAKYLYTLIDIHRHVHMAELPFGKRFKIDGHSRAHVWRNNMSDHLPDQVIVHTWHCENIDDVKSLYTTFDNVKAAEQTQDQVHGALREHGVNFASEIFRSKRFTTGMRDAHWLMFGGSIASNASIYEMIEYWLPELQLLDSINPRRSNFISGILAGALISCRRYGEQALEFWAAYERDQGTKFDGQRDAVQALRERVQGFKQKNMISDRSNRLSLAAAGLSAFDSYQSDFLYSSKGTLRALGNKAMKRWVENAKKRRV